MTCFSVIAAFVLLSLISSDRQRRYNELESVRLAEEQNEAVDGH